MIEILTMTAWEKGCSSGTFKGDENIFLDLGNGYIVVLPKSTKPQIKVSLCILLYVKYTSTFKKEKVKKVHLKFQIRWPRRASCKGDICVKTCREKKKGKLWDISWKSLQVEGTTGLSPSVGTQLKFLRNREVNVAAVE